MGKRKSNAGRPTVMTEAVLDKLEEAFLRGSSDEEACFIADISNAVLYKYQKEHPEFVERKEQLKLRPVVRARETVVEALKTPSYAFEYLKRKQRQEFGDSVDITSGNKPLPIYGGKSRTI